MIRSVIKFSQLEDRWDAEYYRPEFLDLDKGIKNFEALKRGRIGKLKDIAFVDYGYMPLQDYTTKNLGVPLVRVTNIKGGLMIDMEDTKYVPKNYAPENKFTKEGDSLIVQCGNTTGKIGYITRDIASHLYPSFALLVRPRKVSPGYLAAFLNSNLAQRQIFRSISYASVRPNTTKPAVQNIKIPLAHSNLQNNIHNLVQLAFKKYQLSEQKYQQAQKLLNDYLKIDDRDFKFKKTFSLNFSELEDRLDPEYYYSSYFQLQKTLKTKFKYMVLRNVVVSYNTGKAPKEYVNSGVPILKVRNVQDGKIDFKNVDYVTKKFFNDNKKCQLKKHDVIITTTGEGSIGKVDWFIEGFDCAIVPELTRLEIDKNKIDPGYVFIFLQSYAGKAQFMREINRATGQTHLYAKDFINKLVVPIAPKELQTKIVNLYVDQYKLQKKSKQLLDQAKQKVEELIEKGANHG